MKWEKRGLIFDPNHRYPWMETHAANPVALPLGPHRCRVYFASRDAGNRSHVGFVELDVRRPDRILEVSRQPVLAPGPLGYFDDHGVYIASLVGDGDTLWMYYTGWNPGPYPLYYPTVGLASSRDGGLSFRRVSAAPILGRSEFDPWMVSQPCVLKQGNRWRMWYISGYGWSETGGELHSLYNIKYAESGDGLHWKREGLVCIENEPGEYNLARPCVVADRSGYRMWYPLNRGEGYRIGMALSEDGVRWRRRDAEAGIDVSASGWDSEAVTYPWVWTQNGRVWMVYNGNGFGRDGFGLAVAEEVT